MKNVLTVIAAGGGKTNAEPALENSTVAAARAALGGAGAPVWLAPGIACDIPFATPDDPDLARTAVAAAVAGAPCDIVAQKAAGRRKRLLVADMESTVIDNEMIDELAEITGLGAAITAITARSMRGEIDFTQSLIQRVGLFAGRDAALIDQALARLRVVPGAETLVRTMRAHGAHAALVTGGFTPFAEAARARIGFDEAHANEIEIVAGRLTGRVPPPILDRAAKRHWLDRLARERGIDRAATIAVGDGANDLDMLTAAGLAVGYRPKPIVATVADAVIAYGDLTAVLFIQGYRRQDFVG